MATALNIVNDFIAEWRKGKEAHYAAYRQYFRPDTVWENHGWKITTGAEEAIELLEGVGATIVDVHMVKIAATEDTVLTERIDKIMDEDGNVIAATPVAGIFEIENGKIVKWREYFDTKRWASEALNEG